MIDLVLLQKQAYRHVLYNTEFKVHTGNKLNKTNITNDFFVEPF